MDKCSDCEFYEPINGKGRCKVKHPDLSPTTSGSTAVWPVVEGDTKPCGEFARS